MPKKNKLNSLEKTSISITNWVGTPQSILAHTIFFIGIFVLYFIGLTVDKILLILTTAVSLEAIYLAIFIQMTVNRTTTRLESVEDDIEDIQEDVEEISEDIDQIQVEDQSEEENAEEALDNIEKQMQNIIESLDHLKKQVHQHSGK